MTFETFDQSDEETWFDQQKNKQDDKDKYNDKDKEKDKDKDKYISEHLQRAILETCDLFFLQLRTWIHDLTWPLRVTLDHIRNSCNVLYL